MIETINNIMCELSPFLALGVLMCFISMSWMNAEIDRLRKQLAESESHLHDALTEIHRLRNRDYAD
jgi:hypothetical protein